MLQTPRIRQSSTSRSSTRNNLGAELVIATDPDCDRIGIAAPKTKNLQGEWGTFTGNQIGALICEPLIEFLKANGKLTPDHYVVKTLVTTELVRKIAESYKVRTEGNLQVGFKYIAQTMDKCGPENSSSVAKNHTVISLEVMLRDKDASVAAMLITAVALNAKAKGKTLQDKLESLFGNMDFTSSVRFPLRCPASQGMRDMQTIMSRFRTSPPASVGGMNVRQVRDYAGLTQKTVEGAHPLVMRRAAFDGPKGTW